MTVIIRAKSHVRFYERQVDRANSRCGSVKAKNLERVNPLMFTEVYGGRGGSFLYFLRQNTEA